MLAPSAILQRVRGQAGELPAVRRPEQDLPKMDLSLIAADFDGTLANPAIGIAVGICARFWELSSSLSSRACVAFGSALLLHLPYSQSDTGSRIS